MSEPDILQSIYLPSLQSRRRELQRNRTDTDESYVLFKSVIHKYDLPIYCIPGNHDTPVRINSRWQNVLGLQNQTDFLQRMNKYSQNTLLICRHD